MEQQNEDKTLTVGFLNILGQTKLSQPKQKQLEFIVKQHKIDILHMQETNIEDEAFEFCPYIANNYQILAQNNETGYGVCSLVHKKLTTENEFFHPTGRLITFDIGNVTMVNTYLPSGSDTNAKNQRENMCGQIIPNMLLNAKKAGLAGGDFNNITDPRDCSHHPEQKLSPNLKKLITLFKWKDCFRLLHPKVTTYSHFYNRQMAGQGLTQGGSRLDRAYQWGDVKTLASEYIAVSFSDHMLHLVKVEGPETSHQVDPRFQPSFKIRPDIARDEDFKNRVSQIVHGWLEAKELMPLLTWWDLVKKDIRQEAKAFSRERLRRKKARLNYLMLAQVHLSKKVSRGNLTLLPQLKLIQLQINKWFEDEAEKVKLHARLHDIDDSEKVRIFHHEKLYRSINKSSILKLKSEDGVVSGHRDCADPLNKEVQDLLGEETLLDREAQDDLLEDVQEAFTEKDNEMLEKEITNEEVRESLQRSNKNSAPGCDGITFLTYEQCWSSIGSHLCDVIREVVRKGRPTASMRHSFMIFSPKAGKANPPAPKDLRKLALLQTDHKLLTGILAARLRKTEDHTLAPQQYAAGPRRITHAICQARDLINSISPSHKGIAIIETDFVSAYDNLSVKWIWRVLERKKCSPVFIQTLKNIYEISKCYVINIVNNEQQQRILNKKKNIRQGDRTSTILYNYGVDPLLIRLNRRLQGYVYHKLPTAGPSHPLFGPPRPVEARLKALGFVDDVKGVIASVKEFEVLDRALRLFEHSSGSRLHRDTSTKKCQILTLGRWSKWKQSESPLSYMGVVDELRFLGVRLARNSAMSRTLNGDELTKRVQDTIRSYKAGRHSPLICRPFTANTYIMSKVSYRSAVLNLRIQDTNKIQAAVKQWISQNLLLKPPEVLLFREVENGGLGLVNTSARCTANLLKTFVEQCHPQSKFPSLYLNSLYRCYVTEELEPSTVKRPPYYTEEFFQLIKEAREDSNDNILSISTRGWQTRILERSITHLRDPETGLPELIKTEQETRYDQADWVNAWSIRRCQGLSPAHKSWLFQFANGLHLNNERLHRIGKTLSPDCDFCEKVDSRCHLIRCEFNKKVGEGFCRVLTECTGQQVDDDKLSICDMDIPNTLVLPALFTMCEVLKKIQESRAKRQPIKIPKMTAQIKAAAKSYQSSKKHSYVYETVLMWMETHFDSIVVVPTTSSGKMTAVQRGTHPHLSEPVEPKGVGHMQVNAFQTLHNTNNHSCQGARPASERAVSATHREAAVQLDTLHVDTRTAPEQQATIQHVQGHPCQAQPFRRGTACAVTSPGGDSQSKYCDVWGSHHRSGGWHPPLLPHQVEAHQVLRPLQLQQQQLRQQQPPAVISTTSTTTCGHHDIPHGTGPRDHTAGTGDESPETPEPGHAPAAECPRQPAPPTTGQSRRRRPR